MLGSWLHVPGGFYFCTVLLVLLFLWPSIISCNEGLSMESNKSFSLFRVLFFV